MELNEIGRKISFDYRLTKQCDFSLFFLIILSVDKTIRFFAFFLIYVFFGLRHKVYFLAEENAFAQSALIFVAVR